MTRRGPHEGSIHPRKDGRWAGSVHVGWVDGKRIRKHVLGAHPRRGGGEARCPAAGDEGAETDPRPARQGRTVPAHVLEEVARPTIRASTYDSYRDIVEFHLVRGLGRIPLAKLTPADVQAFLNRKREAGLSARRVQMLHAVLRRALRTAEEWGMVSRNVAKLAKPARVPKHEISPLTPEQAQRLFEASSEDRFRGLYITALGTGCRQGELLGLRWEDVDLEAGRLRVLHTLARVDGTLILLEPKTERSRRTVMLPEVVVTALQAHRTRQRVERLVAGSRWVDSGHVFTTSIGTPLEAAVVTRAFQRALARAGLPRSRFHDLRHAAATFALSQGFTLEDVKNLLGHSSIVLTSNTYGHVLEQRQMAVARGMDVVLSVSNG
jgi:integrase